MKEIPQDKHKYIGGVAMGAAALGTGSLEDIERAFYFSQLPIENNNYLHVLGIGSLKRLIPYIIFIQNGLYDGVRLSYDSTTHTSGVAFGHYFTKDSGLVSFNRTFTKEYHTFYEDTMNILDISDLNVEQYHKLMNASAKKHDNDHQFFRCTAGFIMSSITNFIKELDKVVESKTKLLHIANDADFHAPARHLYEVKTKADFDHWYSNFRNYVPSKRVPSSKKSTLEGFFE